MTSITPPPPPPASAQPDAILVSFGDIHISRHWLVTPRGNARLAGTQLTVTDMSYDYQAIPVWAIVLAVVFFPLGLLFLLVKEPRATGYFQVAAGNGELSHQSMIPAIGNNRPAQFYELQNRANYARGLISQA
jgi:hypothetical protein